MRLLGRIREIREALAARRHEKTVDLFERMADDFIRILVSRYGHQCVRGNTVFTFTYKDNSYFGYEVEQPGVRESKIPWLDEVYRKLS